MTAAVTENHKFPDRLQDSVITFVVLSIPLYPSLHGNKGFMSLWLFVCISE